jgi:hypothetical protein
VRRLLPLIPCVCLLGGCGGDDGGFTAEQFVDAVNQRGGALELGAALPSTRSDAEVYALELAGPGAVEGAGADEPAGGDESHGGGSLAVMPDADAGLEEFERCEQAASLLCFRADNVVLLLEGEIEREEIAALATALRTIAAETSGG